MKNKIFIRNWRKAILSEIIKKVGQGNKLRTSLCLNLKFGATK